MSGVLHSVDQRTNLVGQNRLELLLFRLTDDQLYGINVFKVREVLHCPHLVELPNASSNVRGVAHIRGGTISIIDLSAAIGGKQLENVEHCFVVIAEYNRSVQGFLVDSVDRIVNLTWDSVLPPPKGAGHDNYLTAVTQIDNKIIEIIDVEKVLSEVVPGFLDAEYSQETSEKVTELPEDTIKSKKIMVADDSKVARKQITRCVQQMGFEVDAFADGRQALDNINSIIASGQKLTDVYHLIISDIEMPNMDGYTLTSNIRLLDQAKNIYIILHTSLSGVFNEAMVHKVGANAFLAKFNPDELADHVMKQVHGDNYE